MILLYIVHHTANNRGTIWLYRIDDINSFTHCILFLFDQDNDQLKRDQLRRGGRPQSAHSVLQGHGRDSRSSKEVGNRIGAELLWKHLFIMPCYWLGGRHFSWWLWPVGIHTCLYLPQPLRGESQHHLRWVVMIMTIYSFCLFVVFRVGDHLKGGKTVPSSAQEVPYSPHRGTSTPRFTPSRWFIHRTAPGAARASRTRRQSSASGDPRPTCTGSTRPGPPPLCRVPTRAPTPPSRTRSRRPIAGICSTNMLTTSPTMTNRLRPGPWNQIRVPPCQSIAIIQRLRRTRFQILTTPGWCNHRPIIEGTECPSFLLFFLRMNAIVRQLFK